MISSEVTVLFEKACQSTLCLFSSFPSRKSLEKLTTSQRVNTVFIQELTARAHLRSLASRRRMISRADVAAAVSRSDMFDFLIVRRRWRSTSY
jgi:hypothetical protein